MNEVFLVGLELGGWLTELAGPNMSDVPELSFVLDTILQGNSDRSHAQL